MGVNWVETYHWSSYVFVNFSNTGNQTTSVSKDFEDTNAACCVLLLLCDTCTLWKSKHGVLEMPKGASVIICKESVVGNSPLNDLVKKMSSALHIGSYMICGSIYLDRLQHVTSHLRFLRCTSSQHDLILGIRKPPFAVEGSHRLVGLPEGNH